MYLIPQILKNFKISNIYLISQIPVPLLEVRGFVSDINCDLYIFPLTWFEMMHIGERIHELVCIFLVNRQLCDF